MKKRLPIRGSGGGGKGGGGESRTPVEAPDSLRSKQSARVLDLIGEGEIWGLVDGLKSVYLDGVPIQNSNGSYNFSDVVLLARSGTQSQSYIPGFEGTEKEISAGPTKVTQPIPITKSISDTDVDSVRITMSTDSLYSVDTTNGDISGTSVRLQIHVQNNGGGYILFVDSTISGKTTTRYQRAYTVRLPAPGPWDIRVTRVTADETGSVLRNDITWESYTEIIHAKLTYPNRAIVALSVNAEQFPRIPVRAYDVKLLRIKVPSNYDPDTRTYTGEWDGTFQVLWSDNPAWVFYDLATNSRYGMGQYIDETLIDKWSLYTIAQYCDELVDDGFGGQEPRFACNIYIQRRDQALSLLNALASVFRGIAYWGAGTVITSQESPADSTALFTEANVVEGTFNYSGSSLRSRHTVALVTYNDPDLAYRQNVEYVDDPEGIALYGVRETEVTAVGCTSRGQAARLGRHILYAERLETETVTFIAGLDGTFIAPGTIFTTHDQHRVGARYGGRIVSATTTLIELDSAVTLSVSTTYTLCVMLPDGTIGERTITTAAGERSSVVVSPAFSSAPQTDAIWVITSSSLAAETWRCVSVTEVEDLKVEIVGVKYDASRYDAVENGLILEPLPASLIGRAPDAPENLVATEELYIVSSGIVGNRITLGWDSVLSASAYRVTYRREDGNVESRTIGSTTITIDNAPAGTWYFTVTAINALGAPSPTSPLTQNMISASALPIEPQNPTITAMGGLAIIRWDLSNELDVTVGGHFEVRHSPLQVGATWATSTSIESAIPGSGTLASLPLLLGTYLMKTVDAGGRYSTGTAMISTKGAQSISFANVSTIAEHVVFTGIHASTVATDSVLQLQGADYIDDWTAIDSMADWDTGSGGVATMGTYDFAAGFDAGSVSNYQVKKTLKALVVDVENLFDSRTDLMDTWLNFDGVFGNEADATVWVRETDDDPLGTPAWSEWELLDAAVFNARALDFQARLTSNDPSFNIRVLELGAVIEEIV